MTPILIIWSVHFIPIRGQPTSFRTGSQLLKITMFCQLCTFIVFACERLQIVKVSCHEDEKCFQLTECQTTPAFEWSDSFVCVCVCVCVCVRVCVRAHICFKQNIINSNSILWIQHFSSLYSFLPEEWQPWLHSLELEADGRMYLFFFHFYYYSDFNAWQHFKV